MTVVVVYDNVSSYGLLDDNVKFVKGYFSDTMTKIPVDKLAVLRLDGDMYSSTIQVLEAMYDKLSVGGYIIIDDYNSHPNCRTAVTDFREKRNILTEIKVIDCCGAYWKKEEI
jgi:hypothetical protein